MSNQGGSEGAASTELKKDAEYNGVMKSILPWVPYVFLYAAYKIHPVSDIAHEHPLVMGSILSGFALALVVYHANISTPDTHVWTKSIEVRWHAIGTLVVGALMYVATQTDIIQNLTKGH